MRLRIERVTDIPHGGLAVVRRKAGTPVVQLNARLVTEAQAILFGQRLRKDPDLWRTLGETDV
ncbi:hypothetical protein ACGF07_25750 [Kitasatospora sp. NPDC048194]|uniref:hypothetical protein n=1 Tax=Kitasatospora sp. NPDC048194 TaxID=3364045 RepID=UPI0037115E48